MEQNEIEATYGYLLNEPNINISYTNIWINWIESINTPNDLKNIPSEIKKFSKEIIALIDPMTIEEFQVFKNTIKNRKNITPSSYGFHIIQAFMNAIILKMFLISKEYECPESVVLFQMLRFGVVEEVDGYFRIIKNNTKENDNVSKI